MINPRFTNTGAAPVMPGFGMLPPIPDSRHRRSHKHRHGKFTATAFNHNEPAPGFTQHITKPNGATQVSNGYGVPYGVSGYTLSENRDLFQQEKLNQVDGFHPSGMKAKRDRRRDRHSHSNADLSDGVPEQLIGQRSSSVLGNERENVRSPFIRVEGENNSEKSSHRHKRRGRSAQGADGYGHINEDLIFIERGDHSPHRQDPPTGYEYKGKIEVESIEKESQSQNTASFGQSQTNTASGPCPPGWQPATIPPVATSFSSGAAVNPGGFCFGVGSTSVTGALSGFGVNPAQGQLIADYYVEPSTTATGTIESSNIAANTGFTSGSTQHSTTSRAKIIEVWQKRDKSGSRDSPRPGKESKVDLEDFRSDILRAIQDLMKNQDSSQSGSHRKNNDGGTQTQIHSGQTGIQTGGSEKQTSSGGEVRVIVQPIQPVFYMPRQNEASGSSNTGPTGGINSQVQTAGGAPKVVYVPRNVYVPVIKPVFVPRERVIVRPQVIHVARPVLVDRPVPVTQRPIIIDRERPVPVPVRNTQSGNAAANSSVVREEYVYSDNLPVAYGAQCAETHVGTNYGYVPSQQQEQYVSTSTNEVSTNYQSQIFPENSSSNAQGIIEVLDPTVNSSWQRTDQSALFNRYGQSAASIVQKTQQVEQQMYQELRQSASSGDFQRSSSFAAFSSGNGASYGAVGRSY